MSDYCWASDIMLNCMYWILKAGINVYYWASDIMLTCMYQVWKAGKNV